MICRTFDATFLNAVANHPDVLPFLGPAPEGDLDLGPLIHNPANIAIEAEGGGWVLQPLLPGAYELHTLFLPEARGRNYFVQAREALRLVFTSSDALEILTKCPDDNPGAHMAASLMGFRERARREMVWPEDTPICGVSYQAFTLDDWLARDRAIAGLGRGLWAALHPPAGEGLRVTDEALCRLTGAMIAMIRGGQTGKGIGTFNRAAPFLGYSPVVALRDDVVDIAGVIVRVEPDGFGVMI